MNKQTITFTASEQTLTKTGGIEHYASNIVSYIEASFTLGDNWAGYDSIRAVWESGYARIATVLDANNKCIVPAEVLTYKSKVNVNLVGSIVENTVLTDRLTTYPILALTVDADARVDSSETTPVTASQFEQFVDVVRDEASAIQNYTYDSEAWAVGQRAGVDVPSTDETYHNNAKYYADQGATLQQEVSDLKSEINELGVEHFNLYSGINNTDQRYINESTGALVFSGLMETSDYIDVTRYQGDTLNVSYSFTGAFYDSTKTFVSGSGFASSVANDITVTVPSTAKYVRVCAEKTNLPLLQIGKNISRNSYISYDKYSLKNFIYNAKTDEVFESFDYSNLFDPSTITANKYIDGNNGILRNLNGYNVSDYIEIGATNYATVLGAWNMVVCKADKSYSRQVTNKYSNYPYTTKLASDEKYIRITVENAKLATVKAEKNLGISSFTKHDATLLYANQIADNSYKQTKVYIGDGCYFTTINDALTAITDNTERNRYTLFLTEGTYSETITTKDYVDIEGESKFKSIINYVSDDESDWVHRSTIFASTYTTLKNLTVRTTGSKYPLHCDARYNEPYEVIAKNCIFKHDGFTTLPSQGGTAVGIGLYWGQHVKLEECECIANGVVGCASVYCHNSADNDVAHSRFRSLSIKNCVLSNASYGLRLQAIENNQLQDNECVYIGNKNSGNIPVSLEANNYQSWHILSIGNEPSYTQS